MNALIFVAMLVSNAVGIATGWTLRTWRYETEAVDD